MTSPESARPAGFRRIDAADLNRRLTEPGPALLLDVRRSTAFRERPGLPGALPFALDRDPILLPDVSRDRPLFVYCL
jgi:rhodanese-related sulfurtransferase